MDRNECLADRKRLITDNSLSNGDLVLGSHSTVLLIMYFTNSEIVPCAAQRYERASTEAH